MSQAMDRAQARAQELDGQLDRAREAIFQVIDAPMSANTVIVSVSGSTGLDMGKVQREIWNLVHAGDLTLTERLLVDVGKPE